jgi:hypothetical protein
VRVLTSFKKHVWYFLTITEEKPSSISFTIAGRGGVPFFSAKYLTEVLQRDTPVGFTPSVALIKKFFLLKYVTSFQFVGHPIA